LIELLVVIAIIAILISLLVPAVQRVRESAARTQCQNNLKQIALACHSYHGDFHAWPRCGTAANELAWQVHILPYIEQSGLHDQFDVRPTGHYTDPNRLQWALDPVTVYLCPSSFADKMMQGGNNYVNTPDLVNGDSPFTAHYYGVLGPKGTDGYDPSQTYKVFDSAGSYGGLSLGGIFQRDRDVHMKDILDGTSNTLAIGEISWYNEVTGTRYRPWVRGVLAGSSDIWCNSARNVDVAINTPGIDVFNDIAFGSQHRGGANFAMADGSTHFLTDDISMNLYRALASRNGEEAVGLP
jgi:prepilin-type processing-associated H-X9-DG protein